MITLRYKLQALFILVYLYSSIYSKLQERQQDQNWETEMLAKFQQQKTSWNYQANS